MTVETALVLPIVLVVLVAVFELVALAGVRLELTAAAREGARVAATTPDPAAAVDAVRSALTEALASETTVTVTRPSVVGRPTTVELHVVQQLRTPLLTWLSVPIDVRTVMRVER